MGLACVNGAKICDGCMACKPEPLAVYYCVLCGSGIYLDDDFYYVGGKPYCTDCVSEDIA